jgi:hypothetical protein
MNLLDDWYDRKQQNELEKKAWSAAFNARKGRRILLMIHDYYVRRKYRWPTLEEALQWAHTESGEVSEQLLARRPGWVRNNPDDHSEYSEEKLIEEIADQIFMLIVAGMVEGHDVLTVMQTKLERKLLEHENSI